VRLIPTTRGGALWRFTLAALIVIGFTAATTAVAGLLQFKQFAADISLTPPLKHAQITIANPGDPQTLLLIGSDHRAGTPWSSANTDTMMLVRLDPNSSTINLLSIPRDLQVEIPGVGSAKLNAAYSVGGPNLLVQILRQQVFPGIQVNHIIDVNFGGFEALVDQIGCVYTDVDHRYYNNTAVTDYSSIDIQPGYQKLCDANALAFVRYRHGDNDLVRNARQQDFLRWAKQGYSLSELVSNRDTLLKIFGEHTETDPDLHSTDGLINLFNLIAFSDGHAIKQIQFPAILQPCLPPPSGANSTTQQTPCYVTADPNAEEQAFKQFMTVNTSQPSKPSSSFSSTASANSAAPTPKTAPLIADPSDGKAQARQLAASGLPVYYPQLIPTGAEYCSPTNGNCPLGDGNAAAADNVPSGYPRAYQIHDASGTAYASYRMTLVINSGDGEYIGVQGTTWQNPPILAGPTQTRMVGGRQLLLYVNGGKISVVAWRTPQAVYWISNTLRNDLSNQQMIGIAASLTRAG